MKQEISTDIIHTNSCGIYAYSSCTCSLEKSKAVMPLFICESCDQQTDVQTVCVTCGYCRERHCCVCDGKGK
jgi:hypothetical protein